VLDLVNPLGTDGRLFGSGRDAGFDNAWPLRWPAASRQHARKMASCTLPGKGRVCRKIDAAG
jgi:hypothetical protein